MTVIVIDTCSSDLLLKNEQSSAGLSMPEIIILAALIQSIICDVQMEQWTIFPLVNFNFYYFPDHGFGFWYKLVVPCTKS
jgi:hypothetical protein